MTFKESMKIEKIEEVKKVKRETSQSLQIFFKKMMFCAFFFGPATSMGQQIYIKVGEAGIKKSPIAVSYPIYERGFSPSKKQKALIESLYQVLRWDLDVSNYFKILSPESFPKSLPKSQAQEVFLPAWKDSSAEFLLHTRVTIQKGNLHLSSHIYHISESKLISSKSYKAPIRHFRRVAHRVCNDMLFALTGKPSMFLSKIAVVTNHRHPHKELFIMDWDGHNLQQVTQHRSVVLSPQWSPHGKHIAYTTFLKRKKIGRNADLLIFSLNTGKKKLISYRKGINSGAAFHPFHPYMYLTLSYNANPDIYRMDLKGLIQSRLTFGPRGAMNVEPAVSPDGKQIAFSSDRSGKPMIYIMNNKDGKNIRRLTFAGKYNAHPSWSPDGETIAFAAWIHSHFDIYTINVKKKNSLKRLTMAYKPNGKGANNEAPVFSPDGRYILFVSDRKGNKQLFMISHDGQNEHRITFDKYNYEHPTWSSPLSL